MNESEAQAVAYGRRDSDLNGLFRQMSDPESVSSAPSPTEPPPNAFTHTIEGSGQAGCHDMARGGSHTRTRLAIL